VGSGAAGQEMVEFLGAWVWFISFSFLDPRPRSRYEKLPCFSELSHQELARRAAGSGNASTVDSCAKNNLKIMIDIYPIISYL